MQGGRLHWADWKRPLAADGADVVIAALTAAQQRNGLASLWALGADHLLYHRSCDGFENWGEWAAFLG
jgi:hypothetical protein